MRTLLACLFCLPVCFLDDSSVMAEGKHLFILSGQSNMQGHRPDEAFTPTVEKALGKENVDSNPRFAWVDTDDLNDGKNRQGKDITDDLHYSGEGYKTFGRRMAEAALRLIKD